MHIYANLCRNIHMFKKILLCLLLLALSACKEKNDEAIIKLGTSPDFPPFEFKKNGNLVGFEIELAQEIAKKLNKKLEIHEIDFNSLIPALQAQKVDFIASGVTITPERLANIDFSNIYYQGAIIGITHENNKINDISDLANKKIGAQLGSIMENFAKQQQNLLPGISISSLANNLHLLQELKLGRIDVLLLEEGQMREILNANPGFIAYTFPKSGDGYAVAFAKGSVLKDPFNQVIKNLNETGFLKKLENKWLNNEATESTNQFKALAYIPKGILVTLQYALLSVFFGLIIGTILSLFRLSSNKILKFFAISYLSIFRGTPLLLQLFIMYYAMPKFLGINISAFTAGIIAFSMNSGAYVSENIRAGIESVDKGQFEAAKSLGMSYRLMMQHIIMPQAIRNILPSLVNEAINMVKESSIISVIGEADIMRRANIVAAEQYSFSEPLMVAAICYYILVTILSLLAKLLERRLKKL
jgi:His/Glu/Gln/Arg/opine family amino acid ABC transporter permease subunit